MEEVERQRQGFWFLENKLSHLYRVWSTNFKVDRSVQGSAHSFIARRGTARQEGFGFRFRQNDRWNCCTAAEFCDSRRNRGRCGVCVCAKQKHELKVRLGPRAQEFCSAACSDFEVFEAVFRGAR